MTAPINPIPVDSTATRMGSPVPDGWIQPSAWPVRQERELRRAVLHLHRHHCLRCGSEPVRWCVNLDPQGREDPEFLVPACRKCLNQRSDWTTEEVHQLREIALTHAPMLRRMTGWGLPSSPKRRPNRDPRTGKVAPKTPRPRRKSTKTVQVAFRITPQEALTITGGRPDFELNRFARDRLLQRRNQNLDAKQRLARLAQPFAATITTAELSLETIERTLQTHGSAIETYCKRHQTTPFVASLAAEHEAVHDTTATLRALLEALNHHADALAQVFETL